MQALKIKNCTLIAADGIEGWTEEAPYDVIAVTGSMPLLPKALCRLLKPSGRLFVIVGESPVMQAMLLTRRDKESWTEQNLFETDFKPLLHAPQADTFKF